MLYRCLHALSLLLLLATPVSASELRERAALLAREGAFTEAVALLEAHLGSLPSDLAARADLVTVLEWAGQPEAAIAAADGLVAATLEDYALLAWARALRATGQTEAALTLLAPEIARPGRAADVAVLHALLLTDLDRLGEARQRLETLRRVRPDSVEAAAAEAFVARRLGEPGMALRSATDALALDPAHPEALRQRILALVDLGAAEQASALALERPGLLGPADAEHLALSRAAQRIRLAYLAESGSDARRLRANEALAMLQVLKDDPATSPAGRQRAAFDRIAALRATDDMVGVIAAYESLPPGPVPPFVHHAAADAYLARREPARAVMLYRQVLAAAPELFDAELALVYALVESERHAEAIALADRLAEARPAWFYTPDGSRAAPNWERLSVDLTGAMLRAYANRPAEAQARLETLRDDAPASAQVRRPLATVYRWRGWPHRALAEIETAVAYEPQVVAGQLEHALALAALERFAAADAALRSLQVDHPERTDVAREYRNWRDRRRWRLALEAGYADSDGFVDFGSRQRSLRTRVSAPVQAHRWQPYAFQHWARAGFPEGERAWRRAGVGLDWRDRRRHAYLEFASSLAGPTDAGVVAGYDWHRGDHWSFATRLETFSLDAPLRSRELGLTAWKVEAAARWQAHESLDARLGLSRLDLSDGNVRTSMLLSSSQRLYADARHVTTGRADLYASRASREGGLYFNPSRDASLGYTVSHDWLTWRHYDRAFTQRFVLGAGSYWQRDFGSAATGVLRYEHDWRLSRSWRLRYGVGLASRVYDGNRERQFDALVAIEGLF